MVLTLLVVVVGGGGAYVLVRAQAKPDLGADPRGPAHGSNEREISVYAAATLASGLATLHLHSTVPLSEQDLTVLLRAHTGPAIGFSDAHARIRDGHVVVDGSTTWGPLTVIGVGHLTATLVHDADGQPDVSLEITEIDAGSLTLPGFLRDAISQRINQSAPLHGLLASSQLRSLRPNLECVAVHPDALVLGVHAPGIPPDPAACG
jgi:hypothetical protein